MPSELRLFGLLAILMQSIINSTAEKSSPPPPMPFINHHLQLRPMNHVTHPQFSIKDVSNLDSCASSSTNDCVTYCFGPSKHPCNTCHNTPSGYFCRCPTNYVGDASPSGSGCSLRQKNYERAKEFLGTKLIVVLISLIVVLSFCLAFHLVKRRKRNRLRQMFYRQNGGLELPEVLASHGISMDEVKEFTPEEVKLATAGRRHVIGEGGQATVYYGTLAGDIPVAVKVPNELGDMQRKEFLSELAILSRLNHRNVVKLLGFCLRSQNPSLIFEYLSNGNLSEHLHGPKSPVTWDCTMKVVMDVAKAIEYLHSDASTMVFHKDIKSANVLLDTNFSAKLSDFGLSRVVPDDQSEVNTKNIKGTPGYCDPQFRQCGTFSKKSDIFSLGVILAEILTRKLPYDDDRIGRENELGFHFVEMYKAQGLFGIVDRQVIEQAGSLHVIQAVAELTVKCLDDDPRLRPDIGEVKTELSRLLEVERSKTVEY